MLVSACRKGNRYARVAHNIFIQVMWRVPYLAILIYICGSGSMKLINTQHDLSDYGSSPPAPRNPFSVRLRYNLEFLKKNHTPIWQSYRSWKTGAHALSSFIPIVIFTPKEWSLVDGDAVRITRMLAPGCDRGVR